MKFPLIFVRHRALFIGGVVAFCVLGGYALYSDYALTRAYRAYAEVAQRHDEAAYIPGLAENPLRRDLNSALIGALTEGRSSNERRTSAEEGRALLILAEGYIDAVGEVGKDVTIALSSLEDAGESIGVWYARDNIRTVVALAQKRLEIIADVRGLSYRANHHTKEIFDRIIADKGVLTDAHVIALNKLIPSVEEQFDLRSNLYVELEKTTNQITSTIEGW